MPNGVSAVIIFCLPMIYFFTSVVVDYVEVLNSRYLRKYRLSVMGRIGAVHSVMQRPPLGQIEHFIVIGG